MKNNLKLKYKIIILTVFVLWACLFGSFCVNTLKMFNYNYLSLNSIVSTTLNGNKIEIATSSGDYYIFELDN